MSSVGETSVKAQLGVGASQAEVTEWFQQQLLAALNDPLFNLPKSFLTYMTDYVASSGFNLPVGQVIGYQRDQRAFGLTPGQGAALTAAATITPTHWVHTISGATTINNIATSAGVENASVRLICNSAITISSAGNIWANSAGGSRTVPLHAAVTLSYNVLDLTWYVSGVGS